MATATDFSNADYQKEVFISFLWIVGVMILIGGLMAVAAFYPAAVAGKIALDPATTAKYPNLSGFAVFILGNRVAICAVLLLAGIVLFGKRFVDSTTLWLHQRVADQLSTVLKRGKADGVTLEEVVQFRWDYLILHEEKLPLKEVVEEVISMLPDHSRTCAGPIPMPVLTTPPPTPTPVPASAATSTATVPTSMTPFTPYDKPRVLIATRNPRYPTTLLFAYQPVGAEWKSIILGPGQIFDPSFFGLNVVERHVLPGDVSLFLVQWDHCFQVGTVTDEPSDYRGSLVDTIDLGLGDLKFVSFHHISGQELADYGEAMKVLT